MTITEAFTADTFKKGDTFYLVTSYNHHQGAGEIGGRHHDVYRVYRYKVDGIGKKQLRAHLDEAYADDNAYRATTDMKTTVRPEVGALVHWNSGQGGYYATYWVRNLEEVPAKVEELRSYDQHKAPTFEIKYPK